MTKTMDVPFRAILLASAIALPAAARAADSAADQVDFTREPSLAAHAVTIDNGTVAPGGLGQLALRLNAPKDGGWRGGTVSFRLKVTPDRLNYLSLRLWGGDAVDGNLILFCGGKQVGDRLLSDHDALDFGSHAAQFPGAFFYRTAALPAAVIKGRDTIDCRIEATGAIWSYAEAFDKFQKTMSEPSRGIYAISVHTNPWATNPAGADDGTLTLPPVRPGAGKIAPNTPGSETLGLIRARVESGVEGLLKASRPLGQHEIHFLGQIRHKSWTKLSKDPRILPAILKGMDDFAAAYVKDPAIVRLEKSTWNPDWFGFGPIGATLALDPAAYAPFLDAQIPWKDGKRTSRREAYLEMLLASRDWLRTHRRLYTNQSMIVDCFGIYLSNRGIAAIDRSRALPEDEARRYLYEAVGIEEWRGGDLPDGSHSYRQDSSKPGDPMVPTGYFQTTRAGLTRELGYVGNYGEVLDWVETIYDATRPAPGVPGDEKIRAQLAKIALARAPFRYPSADEDGHGAMRMISDIGWRDLKSPGEVTYVERPRAGAASPFSAAVITRDPHLIGYAQQMIAENAVWPALQTYLRDKNFRVTYGLINVIDDIVAIANLPPSASRLPMSEGQPDFAFADPEDGVVAVKRGKERFYASLYWRANRGVTNLGRVWLSGPRGNHIATVAVQTGYVPSGQVWVRPDKAVLLKNNAINQAYGASLAEAGEELPLVKAPEGVTIKPGMDSVFAGHGDSYVLRFGGYTVAVNSSETKPFAFQVPPHEGNELLSGRPMPVGSRLQMQPLSTVIFYSPE